MKKSAFVAVVLVVILASSSFGQVVNGSFLPDLAGWTVAPAGTDAVVSFNEAAVLLSPSDFGLDWTYTWDFDQFWLDDPAPFDFTAVYPEPSGGLVEESRLSQTVLLPGDAESISFDVTVEVYDRIEDGGPPPETDTLSAVIVGATTEELYSITSTDVLFLDEGTEGLVVDHGFDDGYLILKHRVYTQTITADISALAGQSVDLSFALANDYDDTARTTATIDNVSIQAAPAPSFIDIVAQDVAPVSTEGNETAPVTIVAFLVDEEGVPVDVDDKEVTATITSEIGDVIIGSDLTVDGAVEIEADLSPGVYNVVVTVEGSDATDETIIVVYNPESGFVTGGGWIVPQDDGENTHLTRANFGFNARYKKGYPKGHIEFRFSDGYLDLKSYAVTYLIIVDSTTAYFAGSARIGDVCGYLFFVTVEDKSKSGVIDSFKIEIWEPGLDMLDEPTEVAYSTLCAGNIVIHLR